MPIRAMGVDVSFWQDSNATPQQIDFKKAKAAGASFVFIKSSQALYADEDFAYNWNAAKQAGLLRGAYHFYDYRETAKRQSDFVTNLLKNDPGELPPVMDLEQMSAWPLPTAAKLLLAAQSYLGAIEQAFGRKPLFYTNPNMLYYVLKPIPTWLISYPLWIAHYGVPEPTMFTPWPRWTFWQWTDKGDGAFFGMESKNVDMNWFNGSEEELRLWAGVTPTPPGPPLTLEEKVARLWAAHPELHS
jgi:lysozyme